MSAPKPNPPLVDLVIDRLEPGDDVPFALSDASLLEIEAGLRELRSSPLLLANVLGLLELAQHAEDHELPAIATALRKVAETSAEALRDQAESTREVERARLALDCEKKAPMAGEKPPKSSVPLSRMRAADPSTVHHRRMAARERRG